MKLPARREIILLVAFIVAFLLIRSIHYVYHLNFSGDQATFSTTALEIWREKKLVLIGPPISINLGGRQIFQGPLIYYFQLLFLLLGNFDPIKASYLFTIFCAIMIVPLYYGAKNLVNSTAAIILVSLYTFAPYYINFSRFLWNPTFQFSLTPLLIFLMGLYHTRKNKWVFLAISILLGAMLQFHYQFVLAIGALFIYYFLIKRIKISNIFLFVAGLGIGFSSLILFELRNGFYNINTLLLFLSNLDAIDKPGGDYRGHYYLSISFLAYLGLLGVICKLYLSHSKRYLRIKKKSVQKAILVFLIALNVFLASWALIKNAPKPETAFWAATGKWNYLDELKIYTIVKEQGLKNYNIANLAYDAKSVVPKYLMKVDKIDIDYVDYWHNRYLFVIEENGKDYKEDAAYEVKYFAPARELRRWAINDTYTMYLLERS